jgi:hypothetical protein
MKLLISIGSYLLKDILWRWREQPGNVLTRFVVAFALVLPSLGLLGGFVIMAENLEQRLKRNGIDTVFVTESVSSNSDDLASHQRHMRFAPLSEYGEMFQLLQLYGSAQTAHAENVRVVAYPDASLAALDEMIDPDRTVVFLSDTLPVGMPVHAEIDRHFFSAQVQRPSGMVAKLFQDNVVLIPEGMLPRLEARGFMRISLLKAHDLAMIRPLQDAIRMTARLDKLRVYIRSSVKLLDDLKNLRSRQVVWRIALALTAGGVLALVLGTLAVLEYQQRAYVIALLRSFGIRRWAVYVVQLLENAFVVNLAGFSAYVTLVYFQKAIYRGYGRLSAGLSFEQMTVELVLIFTCLNIGVLLSTLPSMHVLKKDIGTVLS